MPRNFRVANVKRYAFGVPNLSTVFTGSNITTGAMLSNYGSYLNGVTQSGRTAVGSSVIVKSSAPALMGMLPGWGIKTTGYATRSATTGQHPAATPKLTVAGTALAVPSNFAFSPFGGTGTLQHAVSGRATSLLRPIFVKAV